MEIAERVPDEKVTQTKKSLRHDLKQAYEDMLLWRKQGERHAYIEAITKVRLYADELLRWELL